LRRRTGTGTCCASTDTSCAAQARAAPLCATSLEGQSLLLTGLAAGQYVLVHRTNADRALYESNYDNDAASVLIGLQWRGSRPVIDVLASCPDSDRCDSVLQAASIATWNRSVPEGMVAAKPAR
jgi:hypothetical protein